MLKSKSSARLTSESACYLKELLTFEYKSHEKAYGIKGWKQREII